MTREEWQILSDRDPRYDGQLFCGLKGPKVVCNVSCALRNREITGVTVFYSVEEAMRQGYSPCCRCRPDRPGWKGAKQELVLAAQRYIEQHSAEKFSLQALSGALYVNGSYLLRTFRENTGNTLLWYHNHMRCEKAKQYLQQSEITISQAGEMAGFTSSSHFSRIFKKMTGVTPTVYRRAYFEQTV